MAHEETIRIYRSSEPGAEPPSLTYGELAANLADRKVFVGGPGGTADMIVLLETSNSGVTGISAGHTGIAVSGTTGFVQVFNMGVLSINGQTGSVQDFYSLTGATSVAYPQGLSGTGFTGDDLLIATGAANDPFRQYVRYANHWFQTGVIGLPNGTFTAPVTAPGYQYSSSAFVSKTAAFDISNSDRGKVFVMSNTTPGEDIGILSGITKGFVADVLVVGDGWVELVPKSDVTLKWVEGRINPPNRIQIVAYDDNNLLATYIPV